MVSPSLSLPCSKVAYIYFSFSSLSKIACFSNSAVIDAISWSNLKLSTLMSEVIDKLDILLLYLMNSCNNL